MVCATSFNGIAPDLLPGEVTVNQWLADDLQAKPGDDIQIKYYVVGTARSLEERTHLFRIKGIVPMRLPFSDRSLMPDFPGLSNATNCRDWDAGFPIKLDAQLFEIALSLHCLDTRCLRARYRYLKLRLRVCLGI